MFLKSPDTPDGSPNLADSKRVSKPKPHGPVFTTGTKSKKSDARPYGDEGMYVRLSLTHRECESSDALSEQVQRANLQRASATLLLFNYDSSGGLVLV